MSRAQTLAKLQSLLARVRARAAEPRHGAANGGAAGLALEDAPLGALVAEALITPEAALAPSLSTPSGATSPPAAEIEADRAAPESTFALAPAASEVGVDGIAVSSAWAAASVDPDADIDIDVDVEIEVAESIAPDAPAEPFEAPASNLAEQPQFGEESPSAERLVAAPSAFADGVEEAGPSAPNEPLEDLVPEPIEPVAERAPALEPVAPAAEGPASTGQSARQTLPPPESAHQIVQRLESDPDPEQPPQEDAAAAIEAPPASSRRLLEPDNRLAELAFGTGAPQPPRHTPPPESGRLPAAPPDEFDADVTGVRDALALSKGDSSAPPPVDEFAPETTRAVLGSSEAVADVVGRAPRFAPATFAELLDATLAL